MKKKQPEALVDTVIEVLSQDGGRKTKLAGVLSVEPGAVNGRFEKIIAEIAALRKDFQTGMERIDRRLDQVDEQLAQVNRRLDQVDRRLDQFDREMAALRKDFQTTIERIDRRLDQIDTRLEEISRQQSQVDRRLAETLNLGVLRVQGVVGGYRQRAGGILEDVIAGLLVAVLGPYGLRPQDVRIRQGWTDEHGKHEIDLVVCDDAEYVFEITWDLRDLREKNLAELSQKMDCAIRHGKLARAKKVLIAVDKDPELPLHCERLGITLV